MSEFTEMAVRKTAHDQGRRHRLGRLVGMMGPFYVAGLIVVVFAFAFLAGQNNSLRKVVDQRDADNKALQAEVATIRATADSLTSDKADLISERLKLENERTRLRDLVRTYEDVIQNATFQRVTATMYQPTTAQCDADPHITADMTEIDIERASEYRIIAVSRDLHERYGGHLKFGDSVILLGAGSRSGVYVVRDLMNSRYKNRVDILVGLDDKPITFTNVMVAPISKKDGEA